ncbi:pentatricopeptide repeat-containing protein 2, mitochondrial-like [Contarinia nasturtii]|uniref:pentatricopeptide repeat-containing protein 2, mitochondrial-like n=1 Tax=Contarinia nasturtii TaxID=265458 RepID=UPI0012D433B2|nr:pentatricopeptide repeat-containing protein 2, mitochondrial-like [Contarinia nasturtii]
MQSLLRGAQIVFKHKIRDARFIYTRTLYTRDELGVVHFEKLRADAFKQFKNLESAIEYKEGIISNFDNYQLDQQRDNLKHYILLIDGKKDELNTLKRFLIKYTDNFNNNTHRVKPFVFGTQIMRLFYFLNLPDEAVTLFRDPDVKECFHQMETYKVLLSLLYENKRYEEVIDLYKQIKLRLDAFELKPSQTVDCLLFASCYLQNTPEHYEYTRKVWQSIKDLKPLRRTQFLLAGLAIKQDDPNFALSLNVFSFYVTSRFIRFIAFTKLGQFEKAFNILNQSIVSCSRGTDTQKPCIGKEMVEDLRRSIEKSGTEEQLNKFNRIYDDLKSFDLLSDETLDEHLCASFPPMLPKNQFKKMQRNIIKDN